MFSSLLQEKKLHVQGYDQGGCCVFPIYRCLICKLVKDKLLVKTTSFSFADLRFMSSILRETFLYETGLILIYLSILLVLENATFARLIGFCEKNVGVFYVINDLIFGYQDFSSFLYMFRQKNDLIFWSYTFE